MVLQGPSPLLHAPLPPPTLTAFPAAHVPLKRQHQDADREAAALWLQSVIRPWDKKKDSFLAASEKMMPPSLRWLHKGQKNIFEKVSSITIRWGHFNVQMFEGNRANKRARDCSFWENYKLRCYCIYKACCCCSKPHITAGKKKKRKRVYQFSKYPINEGGVINQTADMKFTLIDLMKAAGFAHRVAFKSVGFFTDQTLNFKRMTIQ